MYILVHRTPADNTHIYQAHSIEGVWQHIKDIFEDAEYGEEEFDHFRSINQDKLDFWDVFYGEFKIFELEETNNDPHGHIVCVRPSDLEEYFDDDAKYFTQEMLEDMSDSIWQADDDGWTAMFDDCLRVAVNEYKDAWQKQINEEKKRRRNNDV